MRQSRRISRWRNRAVFRGERSPQWPRRISPAWGRSGTAELSVQPVDGPNSGEPGQWPVPRPSRGGKPPGSARPPRCRRCRRVGTCRVNRFRGPHAREAFRDHVGSRTVVQSTVVRPPSGVRTSGVATPAWERLSDMAGLPTLPPLRFGTIRPLSATFPTPATTAGPGATHPGVTKRR